MFSAGLSGLPSQQVENYLHTVENLFTHSQLLANSSHPVTHMLSSLGVLHTGGMFCGCGSQVVACTPLQTKKEGFRSKPKKKRKISLPPLTSHMFVQYLHTPYSLSYARRRKKERLKMNKTENFFSLVYSTVRKVKGTYMYKVDLAIQWLQDVVCKLFFVFVCFVFFCGGTPIPYVYVQAAI